MQIYGCSIFLANDISPLIPFLSHFLLQKGAKRENSVVSICLQPLLLIACVERSFVLCACRYSDMGHCDTHKIEIHDLCTTTQRNTNKRRKMQWCMHHLEYFIEQDRFLVECWQVAEIYWFLLNFKSIRSLLLTFSAIQFVTSSINCTRYKAKIIFKYEVKVRSCLFSKPDISCYQKNGGKC